MDEKLEDCIRKEIAKTPFATQFAFLEMYDCFSEDNCINKVPFKIDEFKQGYCCRLSPLYQHELDKLKEKYEMKDGKAKTEMPFPQMDVHVKK